MTRVIEATFHLKKLKTPNCIKLMTKHPLTDELCFRIVSSTPPLPRDHQNRVLSYDGRILDGMYEKWYESQKHEMRDAYDMGREKGHKEMLNEVISWIKENSWKFVEVIPFTEDEDHEFNHSKFAAHLRKAMYPFPQEDNS